MTNNVEVFEPGKIYFSHEISNKRTFCHENNQNILLRSIREFPKIDQEIDNLQVTKVEKATIKTSLKCHRE